MKSVGEAMAIGRTFKEALQKGIRSMADLLAVLSSAHGREQTGELWGSVWGERMWHWLQGDDFDLEENEHSKSVGHQHVLAPQFRNSEGAWAVAHKLLHKAAMRMRAEKLWASRIGLSIAFVGKAPVRGTTVFGPSKRESWSAEMRLLECQDRIVRFAHRAQRVTEIVVSNSKTRLDFQGC